jgi:hypothetical protein
MGRKCREIGVQELGLGGTWCLFLFELGAGISLLPRGWWWGEGATGFERNGVIPPAVLPYYIPVSEWTAKKAAILGAIFSGASAVFLFATAVAMSWQNGSRGQKDWGVVFGVAFGVLFLCCSVTALLSFFVSVSFITYKRFFGGRRVSPVALTGVSESPRRRVRHPAIVAVAGFAVMMASAKFGPAAVLLVGIPAVLVASAVGGGARSPTKIPLRDALLYVGISVAIVVGIVAYAVYHH